MSWIVLTGGPCSGKTTTLRALAERGYTVVPEAARECITELQAQGQTLETIFSDLPELERRIVALQKKHEATYDRTETVFFDRGMHDCVAYLRRAGLSVIPEVSTALLANHYDAICILDLVPFSNDAVRGESSAEARDIEQYIAATYQEYNFPVFKVPLLSVDERVAHIEHILKTL